MAGIEKQKLLCEILSVEDPSYKIREYYYVYARAISVFHITIIICLIFVI